MPISLPIAFLTIALITVPGVGTAATVDEASRRPDVTLHQRAQEEIIVTARRREESMLSIPISMSVVDADQLANNDVVNLSQITQLTPNMTFDQTAPLSGSTNTSSVFIRGVGQTDFLLTKDPGVGVFLNGAYVGRSPGGVLDMLDVERVEVLRGPQGATFGKNTIGGTINVVTVEPTSELNGKVALTIGDFDRKKIDGVLNLPLTDSLRARFAASRHKRDGYAERVLVGDKLGDTDNIVARSRVVWAPNSSLRLDWLVDYYNADESSVPSALANEDPNQIGAAYTIFAGAHNATLAYHGNEAWDARWLTGDLRRTYATGNNYSNSDVVGSSLTIDRIYKSGARLRSITAWRHVDGEFARDPDASPGLVAHTSNEIEHRQFSQELSLAGTALTDRLDWIAGAFYLTESGSDRVDARVISDTFGAPASGTFFESQGLQIVPPLDIGGPPAETDNKTISAFSEAAYAFSDKIRVASGLRYTRDEKNAYIPSTLSQVGLQILANPAIADTFSDWSVRASFEYRIDERWFTYLSYADGFKGGGFNQRYGSPMAGPTSFDSEQIRSVEVGLKGQLLSDRLRITAAVFSTDYDNVQVLVFDSGLPRTINAAQGQVDGFELEAWFEANDHLRLSASYGFLDARYTSLDAAILGQFGQPIVNPLSTDLRFVNAPDHTLAFSGEYIWSWPGSTSWAAFVHGSYRSDWANDAINTPELVQRGVTLWDARLSVGKENSPWQFALFVNNLSDEEYVVSGVADKVGFGGVEVTVAAPRQWGATIAYQF